MEYRNFGRTGVKVSPLCLGCMNFGGKTELEESCSIIDRALDEGINFVDTANMYSRGKSEEFTGEALKRSGKRGGVVLATKVYARMADDDPNAMGNSRRHIIEQCEASLRRLQTDWIDLYQIHRPSSDTPIDETLGALDDLIRAGKVRYAGTSTFAAWQCMESLWVSERKGLNRFVCEQPPYNILDRRIERELIPMGRTYGYALIPWSPLAGGILTGKYQSGGAAPEGSRYAGKVNQVQIRRLNEASLGTVDQLRPLAEAKGVSLSQFALSWTLQTEGITSSIIGPRTMEQLEDNLKALGVGWTAEELAAVDKIVPPGEMIAPFYEADFGPHSYRV